MWTDAYDVGPIRPPSEAESLLVRVNRNCPWNKCEFCNVYKGTRFEKKSVEEIKRDIDAAAEFFGPETRMLRTAFLQDANALVMKTDDIAAVLEYILSRFPSISRVTSYARAGAIAHKSEEELARLRAAGLTRLHMGVETGFDPLLEFMRKGTTQKELIEAGKKAKAAGFELSMYVMPGLGGRVWQREHAVETARVMNETSPDFIRLRSLSVRPGTPLYDKLASGDFEMPSEAETVEEIRLFIESLECRGPRLISDHMFNLLQEIEGRLPEDKDRMLAAADAFLALSAGEQEIFITGVRTGIFRRLADMKCDTALTQAKRNVQRIREEMAYDPAMQGKNIESYIRKLMESVI